MRALKHIIKRSQQSNTRGRSKKHLMVIDNLLYSKQDIFDLTNIVLRQTKNKLFGESN
jgi:hypothetical protein